MQIKYFQTAWADLKSSEGWFAKILLVSLLELIPILGSVVMYGLFFGWARDIAWGYRNPLPSSIFENRDGKYWGRGFYVFVLAFVLGLIPGVISTLSTAPLGASVSVSTYGSYAYAAPSAAAVMLSGILSLVGLVAALAVEVFTWVGAMRISIYDNLGAGFNLGISWRMIRHDTNGILRIFGMFIIFVIIGSVVASILSSIWAVGLIATVVATVGDSSALAYDPSLVFQLIASAGIGAILGLFFIVYVTVVIVTIGYALVARAMGYWTYQFQVAQWGGKDEPLPFERQAYQAQVQTAQQMYAQANQQAYGQGNSQNYAQQQGYGQPAAQSYQQPQQAYGQPGAAAYQQQYDQNAQQAQSTQPPAERPAGEGESQNQQ